MIHHPVILIPKLVVLAVIIVVLIILHGTLTPGQFKVAVIIAAVVFVALSAVIWIVAAKVLSNPESKIGKATVLFQQASSKDGFTASSDQYASFVGKKGVAITTLSPSGTALVEGKRIHVLTDGVFVEANSPIEIVEAKGSRVVVKAVEQDENTLEN